MGLELFNRCHLHDRAPHVPQALFREVRTSDMLCEG